MKQKSARLSSASLQRLKLVAGTVIGIAALIYLLFNDYGIIRHFSISGELSKISKQVEALEKQQADIQDLIVKLESDYSYLEKLARERLQMVKPGEELYIIKEQKGSFEVEKKTPRMNNR